MNVVEHATIPFLSPAWLLLFGGTWAVIGATLWVGVWLGPEERRLGSKLLGWVSIIQWVVLWTYGITYGYWNVRESLPFHLCGIAGALAILLMLRPRQWTYELTYYWGIPGAANALITPELNWGDTPYLRFDFYLGHGIIVLIALWATIVLGMRPRRGSWWKAFLATQLLLPVVGTVNWLVDANYMFLRRPPAIDSPLIFIREAPYHLLGFEILALAFFALMYLPFAGRRAPADPAPVSG